MARCSMLFTVSSRWALFKYESRGSKSSKKSVDEMIVFFLGDTGIKLPQQAESNARLALKELVELEMHDGEFCKTLANEYMEDVCHSNPNPKSPKRSKFELYWKAADTLLAELVNSVDERRHGEDVAFLSKFISVRDFRNQVIEQMDDDSAPVPSVEYVRLQFVPTNSHCNTAMKYSRRFNVKPLILPKRLQNTRHP